MMFYKICVLIKGNKCVHYIEYKIGAYLRVKRENCYLMP